MLRLGPKNLFTKKSVFSSQSRQINIFGYDLFGKKGAQSAPQEPSFAQQHQQNNAPKSADQQREEMRATNKFYQKAKARKIPVRHIIAISSGKGGVGKSTVAVNVACGLAQLGVKVGLFDGDVHSPSISTMMNLKDPQKEIIYNEETHTNMMNAPENYGVKVMSIGFLKPEGKAVIWKGPLAHYFLDQMISMVNWGADGELDYLIVDFPPGTGDVQLSLCQLMNFEAAIIVTTPQDIALKDVQRGIDMFFNLQIPVMGVVENMSHYECSKCGHKENVFGEDISNKLEFLGKNLRPFARIPLHVDVSVASDKGTPIVLSKPDSPIGRTYRQIAESVHKGIQEKFYEKGSSSQQTKFVVEE